MNSSLCDNLTFFSVLLAITEQIASKLLMNKRLNGKKSMKTLRIGKTLPIAALANCLKELRTTKSSKPSKEEGNANAKATPTNEEIWKTLYLRPQLLQYRTFLITYEIWGVG